MTPAHAPLPTAWNFPFQSTTGSQTSILISESLVGFSVALTRQNAGSVAKGANTGPPGPSSRLNAPDATIVAPVTAPPGSVSAFRSSQGADAAGRTEAACSTITAAAINSDRTTPSCLPFS